MRRPWRNASRHAEATPEPFNPRPHGTWLVVRDSLSRVVETSALEPNADLRVALTTAREARIAQRGITRPSGHSWRSSSARARACATGWVSRRARHRRSGSGG